MIGQTPGQILEDNLKLIERHEEDIERINALENTLMLISKRLDLSNLPKIRKQVEIFGLYNSYNEKV